MEMTSQLSRSGPTENKVIVIEPFTQLSSRNNTWSGDWEPRGELSGDDVAAGEPTVLQIRLLSLNHVEADIEPPSPSYCLASWGTCLVLLQCSCIKSQGMNLVEIDEIKNR